MVLPTEIFRIDLRAVPDCRRLVLVRERGSRNLKGFIVSETIVTQNYTRSQNVSVTVRDGRIDKVTVWVTGVARSTKVLAETVPASRANIDVTTVAATKVFKPRGTRVKARA